MPGVDVFYRTGFMEESVADALKGIVSRFGQVEFSTSELRLEQDDFSFKFYEPSRYDKLSHDVIVRIRLDAFDERVARIDDSMAKELADDIQAVLAHHFDVHRVPGVGVEILLGNVSWGSVSSPSTFRRPGRAQMSADE